MYFVLYEQTCVSKKVKDRWSTKMCSTSSLVKRRCAAQVRWSNEDVLHIFVDLAQRRCSPHLRWSNEDMLLIFIGQTKMCPTSSLTWLTTTSLPINTCSFIGKPWGGLSGQRTCGAHLRWPDQISQRICGAQIRWPTNLLSTSSLTTYLWLSFMHKFVHIRQNTFINDKLQMYIIITIN